MVIYNKEVSLYKGLSIDFSKDVSSILRSHPLNEDYGDIKTTPDTDDG